MTSGAPSNAFAAGKAPAPPRNRNDSAAGERGGASFPWATPACIVLLAVVALFTYRPSFTASFVFDDLDCIVNNPALVELIPSGNIESHLGPKRVIGHLSFALNYRWHGLHVTGYHVVNLVIHFLAAVCLLGIVQGTLRLPRYATTFGHSATGLALAVALLWMVHPLQTQAVTYIVQRLESLMGLFYLVTIYCVLQGSQARLRWPWYAAAFAAVWLGMATKEVMVTAPVVVALYDRVFLASSWRQLLKERGALYAGFVVPVVWLFWGVSSLWFATTATVAPGASGFAISGLTQWQYLLTQTHVIVHYLQLAVWPTQLCFDYRGYFTVPTMAQAALPGLFLIGLLLGSLAAFRWRADVGYLGLAFFLFLAPSSSFYPLVDLAFEHRMYLALAPLVILAVFAVYFLAQKFLKEREAQRFLCVGALVVVAVGFAWRSYTRNLDYRSPERLWKSVLEVNPASFRANLQLGLVYLEAGEYLSLQAGEAAAQEKLELAAAQFAAAGERTNRPALLSNVEMFIGYTRMVQNKPDEAARYFEAAVKANPKNRLAWKDYGDLLARQGKIKEAALHYRKAIELALNYSDALAELGAMEFQLGNEKEGEKRLRKALEFSPQNLAAHRHLAWLLATSANAELRNEKEAVELADWARKVTRDHDWKSLDVAAAAYAEAGRFSDAVEAATKALDLARIQYPDAVDEISARRDLYAAGQPYRQAKPAARSE